MNLLTPKNIYFASILLLLLSSPCWAEFDITFSDTNSVNYYYDSDSDERIFYDYNRLRSDLDIKDSSGQISLKAIGDIETYLSESFIDTGAYKLIEDADPDLPINPYLNILQEDSLFARLYLYRLYTEFKADKSSLTLGLQRIPFGVGRLWNPTDTFNPVDALSLEPQERIGVFAANFTRHLTDFSSLQIISNFAEKMEIDKYGLRYKGHHIGMDMGCSFIKNSSFIMAGAELESNLFNTGIEVRGEAGFFDNDDLDKRYVNGVVGAEYGFANNVTVLAEYFYNGLGDDDKDEYTTDIFINGNWNFSRHYLGAQITYEMNPLTMFSLSSIFNLLDGSFYNGSAVSYSINDETTLSVGANVYIGSDTAEFGDYYDNLYYVKIESYF